METTRYCDIDWNTELLNQLELHWENQLRPRLDGLTDDEYYWEPVPGCWSVRPCAEAISALAMGAGELVMDFAVPAPQPEPVTTIAWRLAHLIVGVFNSRTAAHFGGPPGRPSATGWRARTDWEMWAYATTAAEALRQLDAAHAARINGVRGLGADGLARPCGPAEPFPEASMAALVLHISREVIHHGAEVCLLRDLYQCKGDRDAL